jgi:hypothetical protein
MHSNIQVARQVQDLTLPLQLRYINGNIYSVSVQSDLLYLKLYLVLQVRTYMKRYQKIY